MALNWRNTNQARQQWLRIFLYGPTRSGKTRAAATFPEPTFLIPPNEDSWKSLVGMGMPYLVLGEKDPALVLQDMQEVVNELVTFAKMCTARGQPEAFHAKYGKTIVAESLSHLSDAIVAQLTNNGRKQPDQQTWGLLRGHMLYLRDMLFSLPAHVIFTSLERINTDSSGKVTSAGPRVSGAAGELIPSSCDLIGITEQTLHTPPLYMAHFCRFGSFDGGTRIVGMPPSSYRCGDGKEQATLWQQLEPLIALKKAAPPAPTPETPPQPA